nr:hypothetical protein [Tanacetum cinerariifolium]
VNDVTRLQALVDKKKVVVTEATIRDALCLDDAEEGIFQYEESRKRYTSPLFEGMLVEQEINEEGDVDEHVEEVNTGDADEGDDNAAHGEVPTVSEEQSIPSPTPPTLPPQPPHDIPSTSQRVETSDDIVMDDESNQGRMIAEMDQDDAVVLEDDKEENKDVADIVKDVEESKVDKSAQDQGRQAESQLSETVTAASAIITTAEAQVPVATTVTLIAAPVRVAAAPSRRRKGVVIRDPEEESTTSTIIPAEAKSKDKAIDHVKRKAKEDPAVKRYQARKNMMMYLKNVDGFKLDYFKGMSYDDIRLIFEAKFDSNVAFLLKTKEQIKVDENRALRKINKTPAERVAKRGKLDEEVEDLKRHLQIVSNKDDDVYTKATPLSRKVPVMDYEIIEMNNKPYYKIIRANRTHQLYISFLTLLRNFDREDLEALGSLVKERFSTAKHKNFSDDFLLTTLGAMFKNPDAHA